MFLHIEQTLEDLARVLDGTRHMAVAVPRDIVEINRLAVVGKAIAGELKRTERSSLADGVGNDLVNGALEGITRGRKFIRRSGAEITRAGLRVSIRPRHFHAIKIGEE